MGRQKTTKKNLLHCTVTDSDNNNLNMATMKKLASISIIGKAQKCRKRCSAVPRLFRVLSIDEKVFQFVCISGTVTGRGTLNSTE